MFFAVFSCTMTSTVAGNSTFPLTWSPCVCVLMMVVMGFGVRSLMRSRIGWPHPGFFVSTTTTPDAPMKTAVLPPPPVSMNRLSRSFSTSTTLGAACAAPAAGCCEAATASDRAPTVSNVARTMILFMQPPISVVLRPWTCRFRRSKMRPMKSLLPLVVAVLLPHLAAAQSVSLQDNVLQDWTRLKDTMMKIAAAMPDDKFGYRATAPERTWGEQILHVAEANIVQIGRLGSKAPPPASDMKETSPAAITHTLEASFDFGIAALK